MDSDSYLHLFLRRKLEIGHSVEWLATTALEVPENRGERSFSRGSFDNDRTERETDMKTVEKFCEESKQASGHCQGSY